MLKEFSCGAVVYKISGGNPLFLLVCSKRSGRWGFPKGHIEDGETETDTAKREIFEEAGIKNVQFIEGFRQEDVYMIDGTVPQTKGRIAEKHSVYFLCKTFEEPVVSDKEEIAELRWADVQEAETLLSFDNQKDIIKKAVNIIKNQEGKNG